MSPLSVQDAVLSGPIALALAVALVAGLVSFFSPCCLPLVPVYLGYVSGLASDVPQAPPHGAVSGGTVATVKRPTVKPVAGALLFVLGFAAVFTSYGAAFGQLGRQLVRHQELLVRLSGVVTILMGLVFAGALASAPLLGRTIKPSFKPRVGIVGAPLLGGLFAIGWTPCIGPTLAAVLTLSTTTATAERGAALTFVYSLGLGIPFLLAAFSIDRASGSLRWFRRHGRTVARIGGGFLIVIGVAQVTGVWTAVTVALQGLVAGWQSPL